MTTTGVASTSATFNWTAVSGASGYNIQYRVVGTTTWSTGTSTTNTFNASGLTGGSNYEWQVQTVCTGGGSNFTASTDFTTPCNAPTGMSTSNIATTSAIFNWTAVSGSTLYNIQYRVVGTTTWSTGATANTAYYASRLTGGSNYEWQVETVCSIGNSSFTSSTDFTTPV